MKTHKAFQAALIFLIMFISSSVYPQFGEKQSLVKLQSKHEQYNAVQGDKIKIDFDVFVEETWHINSNKPKEEYLIPSSLEFVQDKNEHGITLESVRFPAASDLKFEFSDEPVSVFQGNFKVTAYIKTPENISPGKYSVSFKLKYQACNNKTCLPPNSIEDEVYLNIVSKQKDSTNLGNGSSIGNNAEEDVKNNSITAITPTKEEEAPVTSKTAVNDSDSLLRKLESSGLFINLIIVFFGGLALNLTPCVYPLIPITIGYFGGQSEGSTKKLFSLGILYVAGMALTYSIIGVVTSLSGSVFGALLQNPFVLVGVALVLVLLALSMFGVYEFQLPVGLVNKVGGAKGGYFGAVLMGLTMGIVAAPCIGPFVLGLVTYVALKADPFYGWVMFFFLALGLGFPYILLALFSGKIKKLPRAGFWMESVKHIFGFLLLGMALYFITPLFPENIRKYALPLYIIIAGLYLLIFDNKSNNSKGFRNFKIVFSVVVLGIAVYLLVPEEKKSPEWHFYSNDIYSSSISERNPIIIDFYADWCIPCKELDASTFSDSRVIIESKRFKNIKVDMTKSLTEESEKIRDKFKISGMPTVLIINSEGKEVNRITGFVNADEFLSIISKVD